MYHRQFFRIISQNPEYLKTQCKDRNNPFFLHGENGFYVIKQNKDIFYLKIIFQIKFTKIPLADFLI